MAGVAKAAVHVGDSKFTTLFREVGLAMMLKTISSPSVGNVIAGFIRSDRMQSAWNWVTPDPTQDFIGALVWRKHWVKDVLYSPTSYDHCQAFQRQELIEKPKEKLQSDNPSDPKQPQYDKRNHAQAAGQTGDCNFETNNCNGNQYPS
jgi:hypothetical protein